MSTREYYDSICKVVTRSPDSPAISVIGRIVAEADRDILFAACGVPHAAGTRALRTVTVLPPIPDIGLRLHLAGVVA